MKVNGRNFALVEYKDAKGELRPCYQLTKTECLYIAMSQRDMAPCDMTVLLSTSALREDSSNRKTKKNEFSLVLSSLIRIFAEK